MKFKALTAVAALMVAMPAITLADPDDDTLVLNGETEMVTKAAAPAHMAETGIDTVMSGWHFRNDDTQAMQADDFDNPGMLAVESAIEAWNTAMQVNDCRTNQMKAEPYKYDSGPMAAMEALISVQSRGMPVNVAIDGPVQAMWEKGKELYYTRTGILELSCASCHEENYGNMIRADHLSQGQINGFPTYRLKNAKLNTVHGRFKGCVRDTRAETYKPGSEEFIALELYVASRGNGLSVEGPSVRN